MAESEKVAVIQTESQELTESDGQDNYEEIPPNIWEYLQTDRGHQIADKIVTIIADLKNTATETFSSERNARLNAEIALRKFQHKVQLVVFALAAILVAGLSIFSKLDPGVSMLLGTMVGYFFGRNKS